MIKKLPLVVLLFLLATLPFQSIASEKENLKNTGSTTTTIECPTIANKTTTICSGSTFSITPTNTLPDVVPAGTTYTWTTPVISPAGALTGGSEQTTGQTNISQTLSNTTTASATATYTVTATSGTCTATFMTTVTVEPTNTITRTSAAGTDGQTVCVNTSITNITYTTTGATSATITGLPAGVTGSWTGNTISITGSPVTNIGSTFNYTITLTGGCGSVTKTGTITVNPYNTITHTSAVGTDAQTICINNAITNITYNTTGATSASIIGLPSGVTGRWAGNVVTISGTPTVYGDFNYTITLSSGCGPITRTGTITVDPNVTIVLTSATSTDAQTICISNAITEITYNTTSATGATIVGLPAGVTGSWAANIVTIKGTPTVAGTFTYTITLTGGCGTIARTGTITVKPAPTLAIDSKVCATDLLSYTITFASNGVVTSTVGTVSGNTVSNIPAGTNVTLTATLNTCIATRVVTAPNCLCSPINPPVSSGDQTICQSDVIPTLTMNVGTNETVDWYTAASVGTILASGSISYTPSAAGTYYAETRNTLTNCTSTTRTPITITINPFATVSAGPNQTICQGNTATLAGTFGGSATAGTWSIVSGGTGTFSNVNLPNAVFTPAAGTTGTIVLRFTSNDQVGPCAAVSSIVNIVINPPATVDAGPNQTICQGNSATLSAIATFGGSMTLGNWSIVAGGTGTFDNMNSLNAIFTPSAETTGTIVLGFTSYPFGACPSVTDAVVITIEAKTSTPVSIIDTSTANNPYAVSAVCEACDVNAIYKWSVGNQTVSNTKEYNYNNLNNGDIVKLTVINPTNCLSGESTMIVTIKRNTLSGKVVYNTDNDNCATGIALQGKAVVAKQNNTTYIGYTNKTGDYEINVPEGTYTLSVNKEVNDPTTISPQNVTVVVQGANNNYNNNFCLSNTSNEHDVAVTMYPLNDARPGFEAKYVLRLQNKDYSFVSGTFTLKYDPTKMNFTSATPTVARNTNGILTWDYSNLTPGAALEINLVMTIITPPTVNSGTVLNYVLTGNLTLTDKNPQDNVYNYNQTVVNSYDPNDKIVVEGAYINEGQAADYLHYITRFQNTGTASAINVVIKETLDSNLDWNTFEPEGTSHPGNIELKLGNELLASFPNIDLADSTTNEPASHGWIAYKIKPKAGFAIGDIAFAKSDIYFDFNAPIITNTVSTQIQLLSATDFESNTVQLYPNPATESFSISTNQEISSITVFDLNGRKVSETKNTNNVNIAKLTSGLYLVEVRTNNGIFRKKLLKN